MGSLVDAVATAATVSGAAISTGRAVHEIAADGAGWCVDGERFDAVVLATPARPTAPLLAAAAPELARLLATMDHAGVVLVSLAVPHWPERLRGRSGYLVPKPVQDRVTAASFGSQKWAHWRGGTGEVLRVSLGRDGSPPDDLDDDAVVRHAVDELGRHTGVDVQPVADAHLALAAGVPAVPPAAPVLAAARRRSRGRRASSSAVPATTASASRRASTRRSAPRRAWPPTSRRDDPHDGGPWPLPDCRPCAAPPASWPRRRCSS